MIRLTRNSLGQVNGVIDDTTGANYPLGSQRCDEWFKANNPDLSDRAPDPVPEDPDKAPMDLVLSKPLAEWTNAELRGLLLLVARRIRRGM